MAPGREQRRDENQWDSGQAGFAKLAHVVDAHRLAAQFVDYDEAPEPGDDPKPGQKPCSFALRHVSVDDENAASARHAAEQATWIGPRSRVGY